MTEVVFQEEEKAKLLPYDGEPYDVPDWHDAIPIFINIILVFGIAYAMSKFMRLGYEDAAPTAIIAGSNHFEVAVAVATTVFGLASGAALATVVGVLTEVPLMLLLVWLCKKTRGFFVYKS